MCIDIEETLAVVKIASQFSLTMRNQYTQINAPLLGPHSTAGV